MSAVSGGTVRLPGPGTYLCGPLALTNKINLEIDAGATLKFLPYSSYPNASGNPPYPLAATNRSAEARRRLIKLYAIFKIAETQRYHEFRGFPT